MISLKGVFFNLGWPILSPVLSALRSVITSDKLPELSGEEVLIVGTSPELDFDLLSNCRSKYSIGLHRVHKIYPKTSWRPTMLFVGDELLIRNQASEIIGSQHRSTILVTGSRFFVPLTRFKRLFTFLKIEDKGDQVLEHFCDLPPDNIYYSGRSVVLLAMQYCIKNRVKKITLTGVNFNYERGYINESINNDGLNQPAPDVAKRQLLGLIGICSDLNIVVEHNV
jgi:hypothetical protein